MSIIATYSSPEPHRFKRHPSRKQVRSHETTKRQRIEITEKITQQECTTGMHWLCEIIYIVSNKQHSVEACTNNTYSSDRLMPAPDIGWAKYIRSPEGTKHFSQQPLKPEIMWWLLLLDFSHGVIVDAGTADRDDVVVVVAKFRGCFMAKVGMRW